MFAPTVYKVGLHCSTQLYTPSDLSKQKETSVFSFLKYWLMGGVLFLDQTKETLLIKNRKLKRRKKGESSVAWVCVPPSWLPLSLFENNEMKLWFILLNNNYALSGHFIPVFYANQDYNFLHQHTRCGSVISNNIFSFVIGHCHSWALAILCSTAVICGDRFT